jgi:ectoine hydroxylase-related dioxygenase (phytanoyl-CoA dioxygenase family)
MSLASTLALTAAQLAAYADDGYLILRKVFSPREITRVAADAQRLARRADLIAPENLRCRHQPHIETGEPLFEVFDPVVDVAPHCARLAKGRRILDPVEAIYGEPAELFKDKLIFKPPGAQGYALHQDHPGWPGFPESFLTVVIAIDAGGEENGCTVVYPGCHKRGRVAPADGQYQMPDEAVREEDATPLVLEPGDVAIFGCFTPHRSAPNRSGQPRRQLFLSYNARSEGGQQREKHYAEFHAYMRARRSEAALYFR